MGSLIVAVRSLLIDGIKETSAFTTPNPDTGQLPEAVFGWKVGSKRREKVWTQNARFHHEPASMRATKTFRDESGAFDVVILVEGLGQTVEWTSTRAVTLGLAVEDWVATHASWQNAVTGLVAMKVQGDGALVEAFNDKGSLAELTYPITYTARLT